MLNPNSGYDPSSGTGGEVKQEILTSKGWSNENEAIFKLDSPNGITGFGIDRIS